MRFMEKKLANLIPISIAYSQAENTLPFYVDLKVKAGSTIAYALDSINFFAKFPEAKGLVVCIYAKAAPLTYILKPYDRIEVLRTLKYDPKLARRQRA